jgi:DNA excision repair protein ERCC-1
LIHLLLQEKMSKETSEASKAKVSNPYAKKKSQTTGGQQSIPTRAVPPLPSATRETFSGATFSQAFSSIEDTVHYQAEVQLAPVAGDPSARADQREFDTKAARDEAARLDARDQHALLQPHVLYVSTKQRGNGVLKYIRNVPFAFSKMVPDYIMSSQRCALFLSIKYHALYPNYIHRRISELKTDFKLRVLLVLVDVEDNANVLLSLNRMAVVHNFTLLLAWTEEEAARYLETFKAFDGKDASSIQKREQTNFIDQAADFLCTVRSVNKTDSAQLLSQFSSIKQIMAASEDELSLCPGLGEKKIKRLWDAFHKPFSSKRARQRKEALQAQEDEDDDDEAEPNVRNASSNAEAVSAAVKKVIAE